MIQTSKKALEALFPGARHGIIAACYTEPERWWTLAELAVELAAAPTRLRRDLHALCAGGVLEQRRVSARTAFRASPEFPFFAELQGLVAKARRWGAAPQLETILVVEDEPATLKISRILLESWGYQVLEAHTATEAIALFEKNQEDVRLLLADVMMPGMTGPELGDLLRTRKPDLRILYMSGYHTQDFLHENQAFLAKPFNPARLARKIREELDRY